MVVLFCCVAVLRSCCAVTSVPISKTANNSNNNKNSNNNSNGNNDNYFFASDAELFSRTNPEFNVFGQRPYHRTYTLACPVAKVKIAVFAWASFGKTSNLPVKRLDLCLENHSFFCLPLTASICLYVSSWLLFAQVPRIGNGSWLCS